MADWRQVNWENTWGNPVYRRTILLALLSVLAGGVIAVLGLTQNTVYMWGAIAIHAVYMHITCYELASTDETPRNK